MYSLALVGEINEESKIKNKQIYAINLDSETEKLFDLLSIKDYLGMKICADLDEVVDNINEQSLNITGKKNILTQKRDFNTFCLKSPPRI